MKFLEETSKSFKPVEAMAELLAPIGGFEGG